MLPFFQHAMSLSPTICQGGGVWGSLLQFTAMMKAGQITDLRCFYDPEERCVHAIVRLGRWGTPIAI